MKFHFWLKEISLFKKAALVYVSNVTVEKFPLIVAPVTKLRLKHVEEYEAQE